VIRRWAIAEVKQCSLRLDGWPKFVISRLIVLRKALCNKLMTRYDVCMMYFIWILLWLKVKVESFVFYFLAIFSTLDSFRNSKTQAQKSESTLTYPVVKRWCFHGNFGYFQSDRSKGIISFRAMCSHVLLLVVLIKCKPLSPFYEFGQRGTRFVYPPPLISNYFAETTFPRPEREKKLSFADFKVYNFNGEHRFKHETSGVCANKGHSSLEPLGTHSPLLLLLLSTLIPLSGVGTTCFYHVVIKLPAYVNPLWNWSRC
jgi:hypothetical protein